MEKETITVEKTSKQAITDENNETVAVVESVEEQVAEQTIEATAVEPTEEPVSEIIEPEKNIIQLSSVELTIAKKSYKILTNYHDALDIDLLNERYSEVLDKYDFIVGDIGFEQLRLRGFFEDSRKRVSIDQKISALKDYLYEFCNFGCAYFVIEKVEKDAQIPVSREAHINEKKGKPRNPKQQPRKKNNPNFKNQQKPKRNEPAKKNEPIKKNEPVKKKNTAQPEKKARNFTIRKTDPS